MATKSDLVERMDRDAGKPSATTWRVLRSLTSSRYVRVAPRGRQGLKSVHLETSELAAAVVLAEAAQLPGDAAAVVDELAGLTVLLAPDSGGQEAVSGGRVSLLDVPSSETLLEWISRQIARLAQPAEREAFRRHLEEFSLTLSLSPSRAVLTFVSTTERGQARTTLTFTHPGDPDRVQRVRPRRQVVIPLGMLLMCGELFEDTLQKTAGGSQPSVFGTPLPPEGSDPVSATGEVVPATSRHKTENPPTVPAVEGSPDDHSKCVAMALDNRSKATHSAGAPQGASVRIFTNGRPSLQVGTDPHARRQHDPPHERGDCHPMPLSRVR